MEGQAYGLERIEEVYGNLINAWDHDIEAWKKIDAAENAIRSALAGVTVEDFLAFCLAKGIAESIARAYIAAVASGRVASSALIGVHHG